MNNQDTNNTEQIQNASHKELTLKDLESIRGGAFRSVDSENKGRQTKINGDEGTEGKQSFTL